MSVTFKSIGITDLTGTDMSQLDIPDSIDAYLHISPQYPR